MLLQLNKKNLSTYIPGYASAKKLFKISFLTFNLANGMQSFKKMGCKV